MSFILDALKKSEIERQRQSVPGLMDTRLAPRRSRLPVWAIGLGVLLAVNLLVLTFVLMRKGSPPPPAPRPAAPAALEDAASADTPSFATNPSRAAQPAQVTPHFSPLDSAPVYAPEIPVTGAQNSAPPAAAKGAAPDASRPAAKPLRRADPLLSDADANAGTEEVLPSISELDLTGSQALPELHLDVHVYATDPGDRFVYINMRKYHEGGRLQEGPVVERIRRDGVVLSYQGLRFILPRQQ